MANTDERVVEFSNFKDHVREKSMWLGSKEITRSMHWLVTREVTTDHGQKLERKIFRKMAIEISDALLKVFDEILVNAIDQYVATIRYPKNIGGQVTNIIVNFDSETGCIEVTNNGPGIKVTVIDNHEDKSIIGKYTVELLMTREYSGSGGFKVKDPDQVTGSVNGLGMKLINLNSARFEIETVDIAAGIYYHQICEKQMDIIRPPTIVNINNMAQVKKAGLTKSQCASHTTVRFWPSYDKLCVKSSTHRQKIADDNDNDNVALGQVPRSKWLTKENAAKFSSLIKFRMYQTAAFVSSVNYRYKNLERVEYANKPLVYYNGHVLDTNLENFARMFLPRSSVSDCVIVTLEHTRDEMQKIMESASNPAEAGRRFPWYIAVALNPFQEMEKMTIVNGIYVSQGASHTDWLVAQIIAALKPRIDKMTKNSEFKLPPSILKNLLFIVDIKQLPVPQFAGQVKQKLALSTDAMANIKNYYTLPEAAINKIWIFVRSRLQQILVTKERNSELKKTNKIPMRKYEKAKNLGNESWLFIPEGDSACKMVRDVIHSNNSGLNSKTCGTLNIQGVPLNALKNVKVVELPNGKTYLSKKKVLRENVGLQNIVEAIGLDWNKDYYYGPPTSHPDFDSMTDDEVSALYTRVEQGNVDYESLNYGALIMATDQDLDGIGQICSLVMVFIHTFWPELIKRGFLRRICTPIIRVYPTAGQRAIDNGHVQNFYSETEFNAWVDRHYGGIHNLPAAVAKNVHYYKGLSSHTEEEVMEDIAPTILNNIYIFTADDFSDENIKAFYGPETGPRKSILQTPVTHTYSTIAYSRKRISCSDHLYIETKSFQLEFMRRKLKCSIDGFIPSQRKAFAAARTFFRQHTQAKVYILTAEVNQRMHYPYGDASMNDAIIKMAQSFTGSNNIPPFISISNGFGDRRNSRDETGHPRYINVGYNAQIMNALFPIEDDWLLRYEYDEGKQCEPTFYVPILPYAILETSTTAAVGWKMGCWARDATSVINAVRDLIMIDDMGPPKITAIDSLPPWVPAGMRVVTGRFRTGKLVSEICIGSYELRKNKLIVTQLPLKSWSYDYKCGLLGINPNSGKLKAERREQRIKESKKENKSRGGNNGRKKTTATKKEESDDDGFDDEELAAIREAEEAEEPGRAAAAARARNGPAEYVVDVFDHTAHDTNNIEIKLKSGAIKAITDKDSGWGNEFINPIEDYFDLAIQMAPHLNLITDNGSVREFKTYEEIMADWYPKRRDLYIQRLARATILLELKVKFYENQLRFCREDADKKINIDGDLSDEEREKILMAAGYVKFNKTNLFVSQYINNVDNLTATICDPAFGASYDYIDKITKKMQSKAGMAALEEELEKVKVELVKLKSKTWKSIWVDDIDKFETILARGIATHWKYTNKKHVFARAAENDAADD